MTIYTIYKKTTNGWRRVGKTPIKEQMEGICKYLKDAGFDEIEVNKREV